MVAKIFPDNVLDGIQAQWRLCNSFVLGICEWLHSEPVLPVQLEGHLCVAATVDTFWPVWEPFVDTSNETILPQPVSRTNNTVLVLKIPTGNETALTPVTGIPNLGKPDELFMAVRFFGNICFVGTLSVCCYLLFI
jgi:hypothetical protein